MFAEEVLTPTDIIAKQSRGHPLFFPSRWLGFELGLWCTCSASFEIVRRNTLHPQRFLLLWQELCTSSVRNRELFNDGLQPRSFLQELFTFGFAVSRVLEDFSTHISCSRIRLAIFSIMPPVVKVSSPSAWQWLVLCSHNFKSAAAAAKFADGVGAITRHALLTVVLETFPIRQIFSSLDEHDVYTLTH